MPGIYAVAGAACAAALLLVPGCVHTRKEAPGAVRELTASEIIDGVPCAKGLAGLDAEGRLRSCLLAGEHAFGGVTLPAGSGFHLRADGSLESVLLRTGTTAELDGHLCGGGPGGWEATFHANGRLASCFLAKFAVIEHVPCRSGGFPVGSRDGGLVRFHANGRLESCVLSELLPWDGYEYPPGTRVVFDDEGRINRAAMGLR